MPDLGKSDANWLLFFRRKSLILSAHRLLKEIRDRFRFEREQSVLIPVNTVYADDDTITMSGVELGVNTDANGELWVRITGSGPYTVSWYTAAGASGLVAQGSANAGATATLTAQNSSGLSGTWGVPSSPATVTTDILKLNAMPDFPKQASKMFDGSLGKDTIELNRFGDAFEQVEADLLTAMGRMNALLAAYATGDDRQAEDFTGLAFDDLASEVESEDSSGAITQKRSGYANVIKQAMADETSGSTQDVQEVAQSSTSGTAGSNNAGSGAIASFTPREHCPAMTVTLECIEGIESDAVGRERFEVRGKWTGESRSELLGIATVGQSFEGAYGFGPLTITHTYSKSNDGANADFVAATSATISGITSQFSDAGDLYVRLAANGSNFDVEFYRTQAGATNALTGELVAKAENIASGAAFVATQRNSSGLQVSWQLGGSEVAGTDVILHYNAFQEDNGTGEPDSFTVVTSRSSEGLIQKTYVDMVERGWLNSISSSPQLPDGLVKRGCFVPYVTVDN